MTETIPTSQMKTSKNYGESCARKENNLFSQCLTSEPPCNQSSFSREDHFSNHLASPPPPPLGQSSLPTRVAFPGKVISPTIRYLSPIGSIFHLDVLSPVVSLTRQNIFPVGQFCWLLGILPGRVILSSRLIENIIFVGTFGQRWTLGMFKACVIC